LPTSSCRGKAERALVRWGILVCLALAFAGLPLALAAETAPNEAHVKAALVYNFAKFVEWPDDANAAAGPLIVGVLGDPQLKAMIHETLREKSVRGRGFEVRFFAAPENVALCHILLVASGDKDSAQRTLYAAQDSPTLTIGQLRGFSDWGGVIELVIEGNQFRFEINAGTARRGGLKLSSRLLRLARAVKGN
jgi:hypothetical protein